MPVNHMSFDSRTLGIELLWLHQIIRGPFLLDFLMVRLAPYLLQSMVEAGKVANLGFPYSSMKKSFWKPKVWVGVSMCHLLESV